MRAPGQSPVQCVLIVLMFAVAPSCCSAADGHVSVQIVDQDGEFTPARAWVDVDGKRLFQPTQPDTVTPYAKDKSFSCDGQFTMAVPAGKAIIHVEKGKEFLAADVQVDVVAGQTLETTIKIERWTNMPQQGWYSADLHVHFGHDDPRVLQQLALADDVHLIPAFTYWLRGRGELWNAEWPADDFTQPLVVDDHHIITRNNIEIERLNGSFPGAGVGATFLFNLHQPVTAVRYGEHFPSDAELCRAARMHSPSAVFDSDKPSWAESVIGVALGMLDTIQVCHNHYHRSNTLTGGYGMIGPLAVGESNAAAGDGLFHRTNSLYYRFLNCGFRLGVSGGSAIGVMPLPTGYNRLYARIDGELTADKLWTAIDDGRTFATSGPMLTLTANDNSIGDTVASSSNQSEAITVRTTVKASEQLESLEIVHNGRVVAFQALTKVTPDPLVESELTLTVSPKRSGWVAARALFRAPDGFLRQAHTSPIYLSIDDRPAASKDDANYMLRWIDQLATIATSHADHFPDDQTRQATLEIYAEARAKYEHVIEQAQLRWGD